MKGFSLYEDKGEWYEDESIKQLILSETRLGLDIEDGEGDIVTVSAQSSDGSIFHGDYRYKKRSYPDGKVRFERYIGQDGSVLFGEWNEGTRSKGRWIIKIEN